jgi:hypothetical protein
MTFLLPSHLLCTYSERFKRALSGEFQEAKELKISVDENYLLINHFIRWMYTKALNTPSPRVALCPLGLHLVVNLYVLGERLVSDTFKIYARTLIFERWRDDMVPERSPEDPVRLLFFCTAHHNLAVLRKNQKFRLLIQTTPEISSAICLNADLEAIQKLPKAPKTLLFK